VKILFLVTTCKTYSFSNISIDRPDLTRKLSCLETWVPRVIKKGHDVLFFEGGAEDTIFDEQHKHLYLPINDEYDYGFNPAPQYERFKLAVSWCLENLEFDYINTITDSDYVNAYSLNENVYNKLQNHDFITSGLGGNGFYLSKNLCEYLVNEDYINEKVYSDVALHFFVENIVNKYNIKISDFESIGLNPYYQYVASEKYSHIHYANGKRMYYLDYLISSYYNKSKIKRKIAFEYPLSLLERDKIHTYDTLDKGNTPLYYNFTTDNNNWEFFGNVSRSHSIPQHHYMIGDGVVYKGLFINVNINENENVFINNILPSIHDEGELYFYFENDYNHIIPLLDKHNIQYTIENNLLNFIDSETITPTENITFTKPFIRIPKQ
jgi:hypothetical protein